MVDEGWRRGLGFQPAACTVGELRGAGVEGLNFAMALQA